MLQPLLRRAADAARTATPALPRTSPLAVWLGGAALGAGMALLLRAAGLDVEIGWLAAAVALLGGLAQEAPQRYLGGDDLAGHPAARTALALLQFALVLHLAHLGFLLPVASVLVAAVHIGWSGSAAWRPIARVVVVATACNQIVIQSGVVPSVVAPAVTHAAMPFVLGLALVAIANLGLAMAARERSAERLATAERRFRHLVQSSTDVVAVLDREGRFGYVSPASLAVLGIAAERLEGTPAADWLDAASQERFRAWLADVLESRDAVPPRLDVRAAGAAGATDASPPTLELTATDLRDEPAVGGVVVHIHDVTVQRAFEARLAHSAAHDPLTGLPNRAGLLPRARAAIAAARPGSAVAILFCDLDGFKSINDRWGHAAGDAALDIVARRLAATLRPGDTVARHGGDEFVVVLTAVDDPDVVSAATTRLRDAVGRPMRLGPGQSVHLGVSIGSVFVTDPATVIEEVLHRADTAMYREKHGRAGDAATLAAAGDHEPA